MKRARRTGIPFGPNARQNLADRVVSLRRGAGMTVRQLAIASTLADVTVQSIESGNFYGSTPNISPYVLVGLADALKVPVSSLVDLSDTSYLACGFSAGDFAVARTVVAGRKARQTRRAKELTGTTTTTCAAPSVSAPPYVAPAPEPAPQARDDEVPSNVDLMKLIRQITDDEDRMIVAELLKELIG